MKTTMARMGGWLGLALLVGCNGPQATPLDYVLGTQRDYPALEQHAAATQAAASTGQPQRWSSERGSSGSVQIRETRYQDRSGRPCRALQQQASMPDRQIDRQVIACQEADGTWLVVEPDWASHPNE